MKRVSLAIIAVALLATTAWAVPARQFERTFTQPDGSVITLILQGDEHFHTYVTTDGLPVMRNEAGNMVYRTLSGASSVIAHNPEVRSQFEKSFISENAPELSAKALRQKALSAPNVHRAPIQRMSQVPQSGSPRVPILLLAYKDYPFLHGSNALATFRQFFSSGDKSAYQYFVDQSNGLFTPQFDVYGPYTLSGNRADYGANVTDYWGNETDKGVGRMVADGCNALDSQIDFSQYDNDHDGACDVVIVLYAGDGEASSYAEGCEDSIWPCQWDLRSSDYGKNLKLDNTTISKFAVFNELNGIDLSQIDGIGTFCHEFSHCLNLPDFYDTEYTGKYFGMGPWSLMDYGSYNDDGYTPIGYSAYEKEFMGWIEIPEITANTKYTLPVLNDTSTPGDMAVKITNDADPNEYYILENRAKQGWDKYMPAEGLMISHFTYLESAWEENEVNNYSLQRATIIPADNDLKLNSNGRFNTNSLKGDLWPYNGVNDLTDESKPAAKVNTGGYMGKPITEITKNNDGTISFWAMKSPLPTLEAPAISDPEAIATNKFTASWSHPNPADATYTLEVSQLVIPSLEKIIETDFTENLKSYPGWTLGSSPYYNEYDTKNKCLRLGSSNNAGSIELSDTFVAGDDEFVTVTITAANYGSDKNVTLHISTICDGEECYYEDIVLGEKATRHVPLLASAGTDTKVKIEVLKPNTTARRALIYDMIVWNGYAGDGVVTQAPRRIVSESGDETRRTISGITDMQFEVLNLAQDETFSYRVKAIPVNPEEYVESDWSETKTVTLASPTSISEVSIDQVPSMWYNLQGLCVARGDGRAVNLPAGTYLRVRGSHADKVMVK